MASKKRQREAAIWRHGRMTAEPQHEAMSGDEAQFRAFKERLIKEIEAGKVGIAKRENG